MEVKLLVVFYSLTGQTAKLARYIAEGAREISGVKVEVKQVPELLNQDFFDTHPGILQSRAGMANIPIATIEDLTSADAVAFGSPVHFGSFASQLKQYIDSLSPVFIKGTMVSKPAACFVTAGSTHGGEEAALLSMMIPLLNLGMLPVGVPYPVVGEGPEFDAGSPYGAIFVTGHKGEKQILEGDIKVARLLGKRLAALAKIIKQGCTSDSECAFLSTQLSNEA